jgi:spore germination protein YaaH
MTRFIAVFMALAILLPAYPVQAADLEVSGWIPWWQDTMGVKSASKQLDNLDTIYPFVFEVSASGSIEDKGGLEDRQWKNLIRKAEREDVEVIPSILWNDGAQIHAVLSNEDKREDHIEEIVEMVEDGDFDGVDIDYEGKLSETKNHFSDFLRELKNELDDKLLTCTVEARMPPENRYRQVPAVIEYANDYEEIGEHCDRIEVMAYDQQRADLLLNDTRKGEPYNPVADADWVKSVLDETINDGIPSRKIMLGVPTYGRKWTVTVAPDWYKDYKSNGAINLPDAEELAEDNDATIGENSAGEKSYTYFNPNSPFKVLDVLPVPDGTRPGFEAAAKALLFANMTKIEVPVELVWYSDADAIADKVSLAEKMGLRGIAIFKIDGEEDQDIWDLF